MRDSLICVDASIVVRLVADPRNKKVQHLWKSWNADRQIIAPSLLYYEVTNALYQYQRVGLISQTSLELSLRAALALPILLHGNAELHREALQLATDLALPATYDAHYLALAQRFTAEFWTSDRRLSRAVRRKLSWVNLLD